MDASVIAMVLVGVGALVAIIVGATRWSGSQQADQRTAVGESDAAIQQVAGALGWTFTPGRVMHHPLVGDIPAFGTAQGTHRGFHVTLRVSQDDAIDPPLVFRTQLTLDAPPGTNFAAGPVGALAQPAQRLVVEPRLITFEPRIPARSRSMSYEFFVLTDGATLREFVEALCDLGQGLVQHPGLR